MTVSAYRANLRVRSRLLQLMAALEIAGVTPIPNRDLHAFAYLANVLSPLWEVEALEGSVLKDRNGPRSSALEHELDLSIGQGLIKIDSLMPDPENPSRLDATYYLNGTAARPVLEEINSLPDETLVSSFLNELAFAFAEIMPEKRDDAAQQDAAWSNPSIASGRIIDFGEFVEQSRGNPTYNVAQEFQRFAPDGIQLNRAEKLLMYVRLLKRRAHG
ncbi:hypothetical protein GOA72_28130 [Sinorhizobium meliloti]|nr:hypothetical protein [Sinorhizobium meliloti]